MSENQNAVAVRDPQVEAIRQQGAVAVERQKALNAITRQLAGMKFGEVSGSSLSAETRYAIAQICELTGANPSLHLYILGGRPYLNADYWAQTVQGQPTFVEYEQIPLTPDYSKRLREMAEEAEKDATAEDADPEVASEIRAEARAHRRLARYVDAARVKYGVPDNALAAYETVIRRLQENAPLAAIRAGHVAREPFIQEVREANWVARGGRKDPVGEARPHETARTRSLRRCAKNAFATTLAPVEEKLRRLEDAIEAEFEVVKSEQPKASAALPADGQPQALRVGAGEPTAAAPAPAGNAKEEKKRFEDGCRVLGIANMDAYAEETLGHAPKGLADYQALNAALTTLEAELSGGEDEEQGSLV